MTNVMVDLETLGVRPGCVFLSLAAVSFDYKAEPKHEFYMNIGLQSAMDAGLQVEANTLQWWLTQRPDVMAKMFEAPHDLQFVLAEFKLWLHQYTVSGVKLWGNSNAFDLSILKAGYEKVGQNAPWSHWLEKDYRTMRDLFTVKADRPVKDSSQAHNPLYDCHYQLSVLRLIHNKYEITF